MTRMRFTIKEISARLSIEVETGRGLVKYLTALHLAVPMGERRPESGMGRAEQVFEFEAGFEDTVRNALVLGQLTG